MRFFATNHYICSMKNHLPTILLILCVVMIMTACNNFGAPPPKKSKEELRLEHEAEWRHTRMVDSIEAARKAEHEEYIRQMARDIVKSGSKGRQHKEPTDGKQMYEDGMVGFDRYEDVDDDDDMRGFMEENDW